MHSTEPAGSTDVYHEMSQITRIQKLYKEEEEPGFLPVRDDGGGQLLVIPSQDALGRLQQRDPAAGFQSLGTFINHHHVKVGFGQQLQGAIRGSTWRKEKVPK